MKSVFVARVQTEEFVEPPESEQLLGELSNWKEFEQLFLTALQRRPHARAIFPGKTIN
jgi:hypothetical protein